VVVVVIVVLLAVALASDRAAERAALLIAVLRGQRTVPRLPRRPRPGPRSDRPSSEQPDPR
jgi:hypothetical protein